MPTKTAAALSDEDIRRKYYETAGYNAWITEMQLDPLQLIVCDDATGKYFRVGVTLDNGDITFANPAEVAIHYVDTAKKLSAIVYDNRAESLSGITAAPQVITAPAAVPPGTIAAPATAPTVPAPVTAPVAPDVSPAGAAIRKMAATATQTPPAVSTAGGSVSTTDKEASGMPFDAAKLRDTLGLSAEASADDALRAFAAALTTLGGGGQTATADPTTAELSAPTPTSAPTPVTVPQLIDGNRPILLDPTQLAALQDSARKGETAWAQLRRNERDGILDEAIRLGKFPGSRRDYWVQLWNQDPDGTRAAVNALAANVIPVLSTGYLGDDAAQRSVADLAFEGLYGKEG